VPIAQQRHPCSCCREEIGAAVREPIVHNKNFAASWKGGLELSDCAPQMGGPLSAGTTTLTLGNVTRGDIVYCPSSSPQDIVSPPALAVALGGDLGRAVSAGVLEGREVDSAG